MLALVEAVAEDKDARVEQKNILKDPAVEAGLATPLGKIVHKEGKIPTRSSKARAESLGADSHGDLYFLWAPGRTALILNIETIAGVNWHPWGIENHSCQPKADGSLADTHAGVPDTCFALLFLMKANLFESLTDKLTELAGPAMGSRN